MSFRYDHCVAYVDDYVYAIGGRGMNGISQKTCERYSVSRNVWEPIAGMNYQRSALTCCASTKNKLIFVIGQAYFLNQNLVIEKYSIEENEWSVIRVKIPLEINLMSFFKNTINVKLAYLDSNLYSQKK